MAPYFKLKAIMSPITVEECEYMTRVPYTSTVDNLIYAIMCTRPDLSQVISMVSRYMYDLGRDHWEAVKWILRCIKGLVWYSRRMLQVSRSVSDILIPTILEPRQTYVHNEICVYIVSSTGQLALYFTVYYFIVYYEAKYMAMTEAIKEVIWFQGLLNNLGID